MNRKLVNLSIAFILLAPLACVFAVTVDYDFNNGLQGWTNINTATSGPSSFVSTTGNYLGLSTPGLSVYQESPFRDDPHNSGLLIRSETFKFDDLSMAQISFQLSGGAGGTAPAYDSDASLTAPSTNEGFVGLMLRNANTGQYILTGSKDANKSTLETTLWQSGLLSGIVNTSDHYTLDLIDTDDGPWGWIALDNVSLTGVSIVPEPASLLLVGLGSLAFLKRRG